MLALAPAPTADLRPLDERDFARLDELLDDIGLEDAMVVEEIDGFLAALACVPDAVEEREVLHEVLGLDEPGDSSTSGEEQTEPVIAEIAALLRRHAAHVVAALDADEFAPVLAYDDEGHSDGVAWALGFLRGAERHPDSWDALLEEDEFGDALDAFESLAATLDEDDDGEDQDESGEERAATVDRAERDALIDRMIADVADIHEYFRPYRKAGTTPAAMRVETVRRAEPKTGRNEPCPCGSGRKYKNCCGAN